MIATTRSAVRGLGSAYRLAWQASRWALSGYFAAAVVAALVPVAQVWLLKELLDLAAAGQGGMLPSGIGLVVAGLASTLLPPASQYLHNQVARQTGRQALADLYLATGRLAGLARLEDPDFRDRLRLAQQAGRSGPVQTVNGGLAVLQSSITLGGLVVVLAAVSPLAAAVVVGAGVPRLVAELRLSRARAVALWQLSPIERREIFYAELQTSLPAAKEMRLLGLSGFFRRRMLVELGEADRQRRALDRRELRMQLGLGLLSAAVSAAGLAWAIVAMSNGQLSVGDLSAFVAAIAGVLAGVGSLVGQIAFVTEALLNYEHYRTILAAEPDLPEPAGAPAVPPLTGEIKLTDVWFRYGPELPWVLQGVNLTIGVGESVALVGLNGAGKSTLVKLLCRFYDPERGSISWDGTDLRELSVASLRERIGAVFQDYMEYDLSVAENIGLGDLPHLDDGDRIRAAAGRADLGETVAALPRGYRTLLSRMFPDAEGDGVETGVMLSGGQWQRVALARAFMRDRRDLLILDEPSSGLDAAAEYEIHHRLRDHRAGRTSVLISHRLGAVRDADRILVLSDGRVAEEGTHAELMTAGGEYARLFTLQSEGYREDLADTDTDTDTATATEPDTGAGTVVAVGSR